MGLNGLKVILASNRRLIRGVSFGMGVLIAVCSINAADLGASDRVDLQSPSMELTVKEYAYDESLTGGSNNYVDINDYTLTLNEDTVINTDGYSYDGKSYSIIKDDTMILKAASADSELIGTLSAGQIVVRLSFGSDWSLIRTEDGTQGYIENASVGEAEEVVIPEDEEVQAEENAAEPVQETPAQPEQPQETQAPVQNEPAPEAASFTETECSMTVYASCSLNTRTGPGITYTKVTTLSTGTPINVVAQTDNGWYKTDSGSYVKASLCLESLPTPTPVPEVTEAPSQPASDPGAGASDFPSYCSSYIGVPYVYAGSSPSGFDCSGFVKYCFLNYYGIYLPHSAHSQSQLGTEVSAADIAVGDIVCFDYDGDGRIDHSGIYIGGDTVIHASSSKGKVVSSTFSAMTGIATIRRVL